mmetsp:Transcript_29343/g.89861  ORF Transcript_29343/g.89861 Transcript_29343/m.89861 type:complete len:214 (+) Transcript_29343:720-1361(+)
MSPAVVRWLPCPKYRRRQRSHDVPHIFGPAGSAPPAVVRSAAQRNLRIERCDGVLPALSDPLRSRRRAWRWLKCAPVSPSRAQAIARKVASQSRLSADTPRALEAGGCTGCAASMQCAVPRRSAKSPHQRGTSRIDAAHAGYARALAQTATLPSAGATMGPSPAGLPFVSASLLRKIGRASDGKSCAPRPIRVCAAAASNRSHQGAVANQAGR